MKYKYQKYQQEVTLLKGIEDIEPYVLKLPAPPPISEFINYGLPPEKQKFKRVELPLELKNIDKKVKTGQLKRKDAIAQIESSNELCDFVEMLWHKRIHGEYQIINGIPLHIPPSYWGYLNFWEMNIGLPDFRADFYHYCTDLWFFSFWDYLVVPNPFCDGAIEMTQRQVGKSYKLGWLLYEATSRSYDSHAGLQSKTDDDAEQTFIKCIVKPWRKLPFFFQPIYSNSTYPKSEGLQFSPRGKKGEQDSMDSLDSDELMGSVTYRASELLAYDGATLIRYGADECGKTISVDCYERWEVVKPALRRMKGKAYMPTTIEELSKMGGKYFKKMFEDSDRQTTKRKKEEIKVDENGETISGLWPWFTPSYCNELWDEFGFSIVENITDAQKQFLKRKGEKIYWLGGKELIDLRIEKIKNQEKKQALIRKHPRNIREAFRSATTKCHFNSEIINKRLDYFTYGYPVEQREIMQFGKFQWKDGIFGGEVEFVPTSFEDARFHKIVLPNEESWRNKKLPASQEGKWKPPHTSKFCGSADTFKYRTKDVKNKKDMSDGSCHVYAYYDPSIDGGLPDTEWLTDDFVLEYLFRPESPEEYCEDVLMIAIYYGCRIYPENNLDNVAQKFKDWGYENYIQVGRKLTINSEAGMVYADETRGGATTNTKMIETMFRNVQQYVLNAGKRCKFYRTLEDFKEVDIDNLNPYDLFVSAAYCLMNGFEINNPMKEKRAANEDSSPPFDYNALRTLMRWN